MLQEKYLTEQSLVFLRTFRILSVWTVYNAFRAKYFGCHEIWYEDTLQKSQNMFKLRMVVWDL